MCRMVCNIAIFLILVLMATVAYAQEHDHQQWNMVGVGRLVAIARADMSVRDVNAHSRTAQAAEEAVSKLHEVMESFECRTMAGKGRPKINTFEPLTKYDKGPLILAEMNDITCLLSPRRQLFPVEPQEFKGLCSQLEWKCDVVWISDGDPAVWHINRWRDIPPHAQQK